MRNVLLIVDDVEINRELLDEMLKNEYETILASNGSEALQILEREHDRIAAVLLDLIMPEVDGFQVLEQIQSKPWRDNIAVIIISNEDQGRIQKRCFDLGVMDFIHRPFDDSLVMRRVDNIVSLYQYKEGLEQKINQQTETLKKQFRLLQVQAEHLKQSKENVIDILGTVVEYRNLESGEHIQRVKGYTRILGEKLMQSYPELGLTKEMLEVIVSASALHDIGKIAIPDAILLKPGQLTNDEFEYMKSHTTRGCEIISNIKNTWDEEYGKVSYEICRYHHERYDGRGYPDGLKGDEIPISAQIVSIADVYDALVNERVYKSAFSKEKAFQMIVTGECGVFSPKLLDCFWNARREFEAMCGEASSDTESTY